MEAYEYTDRDGDRLKIEPSTYGPGEGFILAPGGAFYPADEAPVIAQAILTAAGSTAQVVPGPVAEDAPEADCCVAEAPTPNYAADPGLRLAALRLALSKIEDGDACTDDVIAIAANYLAFLTGETN